MHAMKSRTRLTIARTRLTIAVAALAIHPLPPLGVYAAAPATAGPGDVCSVYLKARADLPASAPSPSRSHGTTHCVLCTGASASVAMLPPAPVPFDVRTALLVVADDRHTVIDKTPSRLQLARGPPSLNLPQ